MFEPAAQMVTDGIQGLVGFIDLLIRYDLEFQQFSLVHGVQRLLDGVIHALIGTAGFFCGIVDNNDFCWIK